MRQSRSISFLISVFAAALLAGCASLPFDSTENSSWTAVDRGKARGTIRIVSVSAERAGDWGALESEIRDLMPLLFSEAGYAVVVPSSSADYYAEVKVREREYTDGWETRRSLSAELRLWAGEGYNSESLPLSAGRALILGKQSLASSKTLSAMLRKAVKSAVQGLVPGGKK